MFKRFPMKTPLASGILAIIALAVFAPPINAEIPTSQCEVDTFNPDAPTFATWSCSRSWEWNITVGVIPFGHITWFTVTDDPTRANAPRRVYGFDQIKWVDIVPRPTTQFGLFSMPTPEGDPKFITQTRPGGYERWTTPAGNVMCWTRIQTTDGTDTRREADPRECL